MSENRNLFTSLQNISMVVTYLFLVGILFFGFWFLLNTLFIVPGFFLALYVILFILGGGLIGAWLWVLVKLPSGLAHAFDPIKNKIASREIATAEDFSLEIGKFIVSYFSFFRFDIVAVQILIKDRNAVLVPGEIQNLTPAGDDYITMSQAGEAVISIGKVSLDGKTTFGYLVPLWFGQEWLGYFCVYSDTQLNKINRNFLKEFEELYLDDQVMHVLFYERTKQKDNLGVNGENK